ncbi:MAG TPA: hypothetical protein VMR51_00460 [Patescibacteria group bacterium]|nr:hypothetical protein [Patescibacteria group bacterium]
MSSFSLFALFVVAGLLLSLNPFNIALFAALIAGAFGKNHTKTMIHGVAISFLLAYGAFMALFGVALLEILSSASINLLNWAGLIVATIAILWGLRFIKDFFWYGNRGGVPRFIHGTLHSYTVKKNDPFSAAILGFIAATSSLIGISIQIISFALILALVKPYSPAWMLLLAVVFLVPLVTIFVFSLRGIKVSAILKWKEDNKAMMRLTIGLTHIVLGWIILLLLNGVLG